MLTARNSCPARATGQLFCPAWCFSRACHCFVRHGVSGGADRSIIHTPPRSTHRNACSFTLSFSLRLNCSGAPPQIGRSPTLSCRKGERILAPSQGSWRGRLASACSPPPRTALSSCQLAVGMVSTCEARTTVFQRSPRSGQASTARGPPPLGISPAPISRSPRGPTWLAAMVAAQRTFTCRWLVSSA